MPTYLFLSKLVKTPSKFQTLYLFCNTAVHLHFCCIFPKSYWKSSIFLSRSKAVKIEFPIKFPHVSLWKKYEITFFLRSAFTHSAQWFEFFKISISFQGYYILHFGFRSIKTTVQLGNNFEIDSLIARKTKTASQMRKFVIEIPSSKKSDSLCIASDFCDFDFGSRSFRVRKKIFRIWEPFVQISFRLNEASSLFQVLEFLSICKRNCLNVWEHQSFLSFELQGPFG